MAPPSQSDAPPIEDLAPELSFDAQRYPARPPRLRPRARRRSTLQTIAPKPFEADGRNPAYVDWLVDQSMLQDAVMLARQLAGNHLMWSNAYAAPDPRSAVEKASVWYTAYPLSLITSRGESFISAIGSEELWSSFETIGITGVHTGPLKLAGGISGWDLTASVDGHFDRISMAIDPVFGTEDQFRALCDIAGTHGGTVIDDIVPGHTGKGADFRLAEMGFKDYPGVYHMVEIPEEHWGLLPSVPEGADSVNLDPQTEAALADVGLIIGQLQRVIFFEPGVKETNWSATRTVYGYDGVPRRWVYLHYFKDGQPSINWLDPTFAGMRLVMGDALHSLLDLGSGGLRLDANGFLGVEKSTNAPAWSEGHPLSQAANQLIGSMVRKVGGFTFQELNLTIDDIAETGEVGPDLSYDFITRPAYHFALLTGDTEFLRLMLREALRLKVDTGSLVHAMQNHDELTYELVHFETRHRDEEYQFRGTSVTGKELAHLIRTEMREKLTGPAAPYNQVFTENGIACTTASVITAALGISDLDSIGEPELAQITDVHLLLCMYNAFQPGVFALSGWDLMGALPLDVDQVASLIKTGDTRWIERGAYDLTGANPEATTSSSGVPVARCLYPALPAQLLDMNSFASRLATLLGLRSRAQIATGTLIAVPDVSDKGLLVLVNRLVTGQIQLTVLNFSPESVAAHVQASEIPEGIVSDITTGEYVDTVDAHGAFALQVRGYSGRILVLDETVKPARLPKKKKKKKH